jgi:hypothetical protein
MYQIRRSRREGRRRLSRVSHSAVQSTWLGKCSLAPQLRLAQFDCQRNSHSLTMFEPYLHKPSTQAVTCEGYRRPSPINSRKLEVISAHSYELSGAQFCTFATPSRSSRMCFVDVVPLSTSIPTSITSAYKATCGGTPTVCDNMVTGFELSSAGFPVSVQNDWYAI